MASNLRIKAEFFAYSPGMNLACFLVNAVLLRFAH